MKKIIITERGGNFWSNNYTKYKSDGNRNKTPLVEEYLNNIRPYLKDIINTLKHLLRGRLN